MYYSGCIPPPLLVTVYKLISKAILENPACTIVHPKSGHPLSLITQSAPQTHPVMPNQGSSGHHAVCSSKQFQVIATIHRELHIELYCRFVSFN